MGRIGSCCEVGDEENFEIILVRQAEILMSITGYDGYAIIGYSEATYYRF